VTATQLNKIERKTLIRAPRSRVWRALTGVPEFCTWFCARTSAAAFEPGVRVDLVSTYPGGECENQAFLMDIVAVVPERRFSWRWHPGSRKPDEDVSSEPMTLVEFSLEDAEGGTLVTVVELGFERLFADRPSRVFKQNDEGWGIQMAALERYLQ